MEHSKNNKPIPIWVRIIAVLVTAMLLMNSKRSKGQDIGYVTGFTKQGISPESIQPIYGITLQKSWMFAALESDFIYSQRMIKNKIQADYFDFILYPKLGYFGKKFGGYVCLGAALNPTINHSGGENHTYLSAQRGIGAQVNILPKTIVELKCVSDKGITGAYYKNGSFVKYHGILVMATLKFRIK